MVGFLCQISTLLHNAMSHLSVNPLVSGCMVVAGAESRAIGISLCLTAIITFALTTHLLFTFSPEMGDWAFTEAVARAGDDGHENELLLRPRHLVNRGKCGVISSQSLTIGQENIHM